MHVLQTELMEIIKYSTPLFIIIIIILISVQFITGFIHKITSLENFFGL